jgi:hypothetical protein
MAASGVEIFGTILFALAVLHTFLVKKIRQLSHRFPDESTTGAFLHLAGEIEVVFGLWAAVFFAGLAILEGTSRVVEYQNGLHFTEPLFVFCIMVMASTRPILEAAQRAIQFCSQGVARLLRLPHEPVDLFFLFVLGPLAGSLITEPAAMTVSALLLSRMIKSHDETAIYLMIAVLFVNVSIGGALTPYAAPPILMVVGKWGWGLAEVFSLFGSKALLAVFLNALILVLLFWKKLDADVHAFHELPKREPIPAWVIVVHLILLALLVLNAHHPNMAMGMLLLFLGVTTVTKNHQDALRLRESLLVAFFLGGLIVFGPLQAWWLSPVLRSLDAFALFVGATALTAITDNAALTYLGSQVEGLSEVSKYFLVAGAVTGGGLTIIANAPNAAGYTILQDRFPGGLHPGKLFVAALGPTLIAFLCFGFL